MELANPFPATPKVILPRSICSTSVWMPLLHQVPNYSAPICTTKQLCYRIIMSKQAWFEDDGWGATRYFELREMSGFFIPMLPAVDSKKISHPVKGTQMDILSRIKSRIPSAQLFIATLSVEKEPMICSFAESAVYGRVDYDGVGIYCNPFVWSWMAFYGHSCITFYLSPYKLFGR